MKEELEISMTDWYSCNLCRSDNYILNSFPETHWAYRCFKTRDKNTFDSHEQSYEHMKHFEQYYCKDCDIQNYCSADFKKHCDTIKHKTNCNITMECKLCDYTTSNKYSFEVHTFSKKHQNALKGIEKEEFKCETCNFKSKYKSKLIEHEESKKHQNAVNGTFIKEDIVCELCNYKTKYKSQMQLHEQTIKHQNKLKAVEVVE